MIADEPDESRRAYMTRAQAGARFRAAVSTAFISWVVALMTTNSVASLWPSPSMAVYGLAAVLFYLVPAIVFLLSTPLVSAEFARRYEGGTSGGTQTHPVNRR